mgnify:CR=1 FL=1
MIALSIRRKIMEIAVALIVLMAITSVMTVVLVMQVGERIEELDLQLRARLWRPRARQHPLAGAGACDTPDHHRKIQSPDDTDQYTALRNRYDALGGQVQLEILAARALIQGLIQKGPAFGDATTLSQFETRIDAINDDSRRRLNAENDRLLKVCSTPATRKHSPRKWNGSTSSATNSTASSTVYGRICWPCCAGTPT